MKQRKIWIRKKKEKGDLARYIVEGKRGKKTIFIWTISNDLTELLCHLIKSSFFSKEKGEKIAKILDSLNNSEETEDFD